MADTISGIHHITAVASDPQRNLDFYTQTLGLRLVKLTVNFDDPGTYHFYFGDYPGSPGTILTFFPWTNIRPGSRGTGQVTAVSFTVPGGSLPFWQQRLRQAGVSQSEPFERFGEPVLTFLDPDGMQLELIETDAVRGAGPESIVLSGVPYSAAASGFGPPALTSRMFSATARLLEQVLGFERVGQEGTRHRFRAGGQSARVIGDTLDLEERPNEPAGGMGSGVVHHIALRARDDEHQLALRERLIEARMEVTPVLDRQYFHSIYFREPGGILFEIATDPPGFALDEPVEGLGARLRLPPWLEPRRASIEAGLPRLRMPVIE